MKIYEIQYELAKTENERTGLKYTNKIQADNKIHACKKIFLLFNPIDKNHWLKTSQVLNKNYKINIQK